MEIPPLSSAQKRELKGRAHKLHPAVLVGGKGITAGLIAEVNRALEAHELIKIRAAALERSEREWMLNELCQRTGSQAVQCIGKVLVLFRRIPKPEPTAKRAVLGPRPPTRSGRRESRSASARPASERPRRPRRTSR